MAEWVFDGFNDDVHCSDCGYAPFLAEESLTEICPKCGAKMEVITTDSEFLEDYEKLRALHIV